MFVVAAQGRGLALSMCVVSVCWLVMAPVLRSGAGYVPPGGDPLSWGQIVLFVCLFFVCTLKCPH